MIISIHRKYFQEKKGIVEFILKSLKVEDYNIVESNSCVDTIFEFNNRKIIIEDFFFKFLSDSSSFPINELEVPKKIKKSVIEGIAIPILYGSDSIILNGSNYIVKIDIISSIFFMLYRWEDHLMESKDNHNRPIGKNSLAYKYDFLKYPVVDRYIELLGKFLTNLGIGVKFSKQKKTYLSHDIDYTEKYSRRLLIKYIFNNLKTKNFTKINEDISHYFNGFEKDPYNTYDILMDLSERSKVKSVFYVMTGGITNKDNNFKFKSKKTRRILENILTRGHEIGLHPSYEAYNNSYLLEKEKFNLDNFLNFKSQKVRSHYLRFDIINTPKLYDDFRFAEDSTLGYADASGFRCGTAKKFNLYDFNERKFLSIKEQPLIFMDCTPFKYSNLNELESFDNFLNSYSNSIEYSILWHNSYVEYFKLYEKIINYITNKS
jgi:hypothetical protein